MNIQNLQDKIEKLELQIFHLKNSNLNKGNICLKDFPNHGKLKNQKDYIFMKMD